MAVLTDLLFSAIGSHQANQQYGKIAADYTTAEKNATNAFAPYASAGATGATNEQNMVTPGFAFSPADPSYAFRLNQGANVFDRSAAARGDLFSGGQTKALTRYGQDYASTEYGNEFARNATLAGQGLTAAQGDASAGFQGAAGRAGAYSAQAGNNSGFWGGLGASFNNGMNTAAAKFGYGG